jgi:APA family basic amino acid/polyamine antiporter
LIGPLGVIGCLYLFTSLPTLTIELFFAWNSLGILLYLAFARRSSLLATA